MKIELPKNVWINEVDLGFCREGYWNGAMMLTISVSGAPLDFEFATAMFEKLLKIPMPRRRIVRIKGMFNAQDSNLDTIIRAFKTYGFIVQVITNGNTAYSWMDAVDWHILRTERPLVMMDCDEVWYCPPPIEPIPEPTIPTNPGHNIFLYISKGHSVTATNDFVIQSKNNWNVL